MLKNSYLTHTHTHTHPHTNEIHLNILNMAIGSHYMKNYKILIFHVNENTYMCSFYSNPCVRELKIGTKIRIDVLS